MFRSTLAKPWVIAALALSGAACANGADKGAENATRAEQASGSSTYTGSMTATVEDVNRDSRTITLRGPEGDTMVVQAGDEVNMGNIDPGDRVHMNYQGTLQFALQQPNTEPVAEAQTSTERLPEGVQFGRNVKATVQIVSVDPQGKSVTFRNREGDVRTVDVMNPDNQPHVAKLRPGDMVTVTYTEKLAIELEKQGL